MLINQKDYTAETVHISIEGDHFMYVGQGESIPTIYLQTGSRKTVEQYSVLLMYGSSSRPSIDGRNNPPEIPVGQSIVPDIGKIDSPLHVIKEICANPGRI